MLRTLAILALLSLPTAANAQSANSATPPPKVIVLTAMPGGTEVRLYGSSVLRLRKSYGHVPGSATLVNWPGDTYVREEPDVVAKLVEAELPSLHMFLGQQGKDHPVWVDLKKSTGPIWTSPTERKDGANSAIMLGGKKQFLSNSHTEVHDAIAAAGGTTNPIPQDSVLMSIKDFFNQMTTFSAPVPTWD